MGVLDTKLGDVAPDTTHGLCCTGTCSILLLIFVILLGPSSVGQVNRLHFGLRKNGFTGEVDLDTVHQPGRYYVGFWNNIIQFPSYLFTIEFSDENPEDGVDYLSVLQTRDQEGKRIMLDISVQVLLNEKHIGTMYKEMLTSYKSVFTAELRHNLAKAGNLFKIEEAWTDYDKVLGALTQACEEALAPRHAECWALQLWGIRLEPKYEAALIKTQVKKQAERTEQQRSRTKVVRAQTNVILAEFKKNKTIIEANGTAQKFLMENEAMAKAESNIINAQANATQLVRSIVKLDSEGHEMTEQQAIEYMKRVMIKNMTSTNFLVLGRDPPLNAINAQAYKNLGESGLGVRDEEAGPQAGSGSGSGSD